MKDKEEIEKSLAQFQRIAEELHNLHQTSGFALMATIIGISIVSMYGIPKLLPLSQLLFIPITAAVIQQTCYYWGLLCEERAGARVVLTEMALKDDPKSAREHLEEAAINVGRAPVLFAIAETAGLIAPLTFLLLGCFGFASSYR